jgi:FkbM family methyltransferase
MSKIDATKFVFSCQNWPELIIPIATHKRPARITLRNGIRFVSDFLYWPDIYGIFSQQMYTPSFLPIELDDVVVDIGANIGVFSLYAATRTSNTVHAFEPFPANIAALQQNISANQVSTIEIHQYAISDVIGMEHFSTKANGINHLQKAFVEPTDVFMDVPAISLDAFMDEHHVDHIDFLKMDCEGAEGVILPSLSASLFQHIRKIALEFHDDVCQLKHIQLQALLTDVGFATHLDWDGKAAHGIIHAWRR